MSDDTFNGFDDLEGDWEGQLIASTKAICKDGVKYPCTKCGGTGIYGGVRIHQPKANCFVCNGRGYFKTSAADRAKAKLSRDGRKATAAVKKQSELEAKAAVWIEAHEELHIFLKKVCSWNGFAESLLRSVSDYGSLTDNQLAAAEKMHTKHIAKQAEVKKSAPIIDLTKINALFDTARESGLKKPRLHIGSLVISIAPPTGKNVGCLYIKDHGEYAGKITADGELRKLRTASEDLQATLDKLAASPLEAAKEYGRDTGTCMCCGRLLTDPKSIAAGIGPICEGRWF